jgi:hypothetical protein
VRGLVLVVTLSGAKALPTHAHEPAGDEHSNHARAIQLMAWTVADTGSSKCAARGTGRGGSRRGCSWPDTITVEVAARRRSAVTRRTRLVVCDRVSGQPAGRLHGLIVGFRNNVSQSQQSIPNAWAAALNIGAGPSPALLSRLSYLFKLPDEIKHELELVDAEEYDSDLALRWQHVVPGQMNTCSTAVRRVRSLPR